MSRHHAPPLAGGQIHQVFLKPGDWCFAEEPLLMRTVLGACVALTVWHPLLRFGGMCHYLLPRRHEAAPLSPLDGRFADEAMRLLLSAMYQVGSRPADYRVRMFGGAQWAGGASHDQLALRNVEAGRALVQCHGLVLAANDVGGSSHRQVVFDSWSGEAWVRHHEGELLRSDAGGGSGACASP